MYRNIPIKLNTMVNSKETLIEKLRELKNIYRVGINQQLFANVITNLHNNQSSNPTTWNNMTLSEWVQFLEPYLEGEKITEDQLIIVFDYLNKFHNGVIRPNGDKFNLKVKSLYYNDNFLFEDIGLMILEI